MVPLGGVVVPLGGVARFQVRAPIGATQERRTLNALHRAIRDLVCAGQERVSTRRGRRVTVPRPTQTENAPRKFQRKSCTNDRMAQAPTTGDGTGWCADATFR